MRQQQIALEYRQQWSQQPNQQSEYQAFSLSIASKTSLSHHTVSTNFKIVSFHAAVSGTRALYFYSSINYFPVVISYASYGVDLSFLYCFWNKSCAGLK